MARTPSSSLSWTQTAAANEQIRILGQRNGQVAAAGELRLQEVAPGEWRATLSIESASTEWLSELLSTAEEEARLHNDGASLTFCVNGTALEEWQRKVLAESGMVLAVAEHEMRRATGHLAEAPVAGALAYRSWDEQAAPLFFHAYEHAFRERPGFPNWDEERWRASFIESESFRPGLSAVLLDGPEPAAFLVAWVEGGSGWITQMGVRPEWRGRGLGESLIARTLAAFAAEGLQSAALEVATNNAAAQALYERMGFAVTSTHESWRKRLV